MPQLRRRLTVTDYRGHRQTLLPVREINLKACTPIILKAETIYLAYTWGLNPDPADNRFRLSVHRANEPHRLAHLSPVYCSGPTRRDPRG